MTSLIQRTLRRRLAALVVLWPAWALLITMFNVYGVVDADVVLRLVT